MVKLALPAGELRDSLAHLLAAADLRVSGYGEGSRSYRLGLDGRDGVSARVFREKDIPIQIALGNYDLGVCGSLWVEEMRARYPEQPVVLLRDLGIGSMEMYVAAAAGTFEDVSSLALSGLRIASEFPNLAEAFAMAVRLPAYRVQAVWGAAEAYPPEDADIAVIAAAQGEELRDHRLVPLFRLLEGSAWLIANRESLRRKDLSPLLRPLLAGGAQARGHPRLELPSSPARGGMHSRPSPAERQMVRLALPDGHQQRHAVAALAAAGLALDGYDESRCDRRPASPVAGLEVKVVRPHDMPQLVATGEMDLAVTGRDCLMEHLYRFPSSPAEEVVDLQRCPFNLSAVVSEDVPADSIADALAYWRSQGKRTLRVASEFPGIADHYARRKHFWRYQVIPIAGASEGFVPEDAELLIEGTETGKTLAENRLKAIDTLFRSTICLIARRGREMSGQRRQVFDEVVASLRRSAEAVQRV